MRIFGIFTVLLLIALVGAAAYVRLAPSDPAIWHVDPLTTADPFQPHFARVDRVLPLSPEALGAEIAARAEREGAELLAGEPSDWATWVARTPLMAFPDYISIRLIPQGEDTRVVAFSRSRFGYSDRGVNRARLGRWIPQ